MDEHKQTRPRLRQWVCGNDDEGCFFHCTTALDVALSVNQAFLSFRDNSFLVVAGGQNAIDDSATQDRSLLRLCLFGQSMVCRSSERRCRLEPACLACGGYLRLSFS